MVGKKILNYQVISLLGEGGMGSVYKAFDIQLQRYVAIKIIHPKLLKDPIAIERFRVEAINQAKLNHPNIVTVFGFIETREATGFVMEYVDGSTISQLIETYGRLDLIYSLRVIQQVLIAIEYAHNLGFVHRDLKPSNIIIDTNGIVKIMDFGISKSLKENHNLTRVGFNVGTIHYMSPEQIKGLELSPRTDLYSIGITLFEMLSGTPPFNFKSDYEIYEAHLKMIPKKLSSSLQEIPEEVDELILSALNKSTKKNFLTAYEFRTSIEHLIFNLPLLVGKPSANNVQNQRNLKHKNRSSNFIIGFVVLLTLLIVGAAYFLVDKFILRERLSSLSEDRTKIYYLKSDTFFPEPWEELDNITNSNISGITNLNSYLFLLGSGSSIYYSSDNGKNWIKVKVNKDIDFNDIEVLNENLLAVGTGGNLILISSTGRIIQFQKVTEENLFSISIKNHIYLCGSNGVILKSDKHRLNFQKIKTPTSSTLYDICEIDDNTFLTTGWDGTIYKSNDNGINFNRIKLSNNYLKRLCFINEFLGFTGGFEGSLFRTTDGGDSWNKINLDTKATINDIIFVNQKTGFIVTSEGDLFVSDNSGSDWLIAKKGFNNSLNKILVLNNGTIILVGNNGTILKNKI